MNEPAQTIALAPDQGEFFTIIGGGVRVLIDGQASGGRCCMFEVPVEPGDGPPLHRHDREDELFYVLEGKFKISVNGHVAVGERGTFICAPRGSVHAFRNVGSTTGKLLVMCTPAGLEAAFRSIRNPEPGSSEQPPAMDDVVAILDRHGVTFHGPPLEP